MYFLLLIKKVRNLYCEIKRFIESPSPGSCHKMLVLTVIEWAENKF